MYSFKQFMNEAWEDYEKASDERKAELIKHHENLTKEHLAKEKEHRKVKASDPKGLEHNIAATAHRSAATLHSHVVSGIEHKIHGLAGVNQFKIDADKMSKAAHARSELANK